MSRKATNELLQKAKRLKSDEFYTQLTDIERELQHYKTKFDGKVVFCNCDNPLVSNFYKYFAVNFKSLGLRKLIAACYKNQETDLFSIQTNERAFYYEYSGGVLTSG